VNAATAAAVTIWMVFLVVLLLRNGLTAMGGKDYLVPMLVYIPTAAFFVVLFSAHHFRPALRMWLDKMCIHQSDEAMKKLGMEAMLEIVRASDRLCILWDDTYFERLWCNAEIATFCATHGGPSGVDLVPLWLPPWIVMAMLLDILCSSLSAHFAWLSQAIAGFLTSVLGEELWVWCLAAPCIGVVQWAISYLPLLIPNYFAMTSKIHQHEAMFQLLRGFRHAEAKCTVETDRKVIGEHISTLFADTGDSPEQAVARFDKFMREDLLRMIREKVGAAAMLPRREAFLVVLPLIFTSSAIVLSCDGADCADSARVEMPPPPLRLDQLTAYMLLNSVVYSSGALLVFPATYPLVLQLVGRATRVEDDCLRASLVLLSIVLGYCWMGLGLGVTCGLMLYATTYGGVYVVAVFAHLATLALVFWWLTSVRGPTRKRRMSL